MTKEDTYKAIDSLKNFKSPGIDVIPSKLIKCDRKEMHYFMFKLCQKIWKEHLPKKNRNEAIILLP